MATHFEPKEKKSKLEEAFEYASKKLSDAGMNPAGDIIKQVDEERKKTHEDYPRQLYKSMKGKY